MIKCDGQSGNGFAVGDNDAGSYNPNGTAWNETRRVISFWYKGGFSTIYVMVSTSSGRKFLQYYSGNGTNYLDGSGNVCFYLGSGAAASIWKRFERNIEEDWESISAATWTNTDGLLIRPDSTASYDFYIDDIRFSNSRTKTHNTLSGGSIGQIVSAKNYMSDSYGQPENVWYSYDHIGNVMNLSDAAGDKTTEYAQDAFGNVLSSATTGAWASSASGRHLTTKEYDDNVDFYYFWQRWYDPLVGRFLSNAPYAKDIEHPYTFCKSNPINYIDIWGLIEIYTPTPTPEPLPIPTPAPTWYDELTDKDGDGIPDCADPYPDSVCPPPKPPSYSECFVACLGAGNSLSTTVVGSTASVCGALVGSSLIGVSGAIHLRWTIQYCHTVCLFGRPYGEWK